MADMPGDAVVAVRRQDGCAIVEIDNPPINAGSTPVRRALLAAFRALACDGAVEAIVLIGARGMFMAGSDMREMNLPVVDPSLPDVIRAIEDCPTPVVAAIAGAALGGGYELALGCDARVATRDAMVGLPECLLGMIPGAGGTQRLPRLSGLAKAIELICSGARVRADRAVGIGMVDEVVDVDLLGAAITYAKGMNGRKRRAIELCVPAVDEAELARVKAEARAAGGGRPHIEQAIATVETARTLSPEEALAAERDIFLRLRAGRESAAMLHLFFAEREAAKARWPRGVSPKTVEIVVVLGDGPVAEEFTALFLRAGKRVRLVRGRADESHERAAQRLARRIGPEPGANSRFEIIDPDAEWDEVDAVIDAAVAGAEHGVAITRRVTRALDSGAILMRAIAPDGTAAAAIADVSGAVDLYLAAEGGRLVEVAPHPAASAQAIATAAALLRSAGKLPVVVGAASATVGKRLRDAWRDAVDGLLRDGVPLEAIDAATDEFGFSASWRVSPDKPSEPEHHGTPRVNEGMQANPTTILRHVLTAMASEAARLVESGGVVAATDIDLIVTTGYGFPRHQGGIVFWVGRERPEDLAATLRQLTDADGRSRGDMSLEPLLRG